MKVLKHGSVQIGQIDDEQLALIHRQTLREVPAEDLYMFRVVGCDDQIDRDYERFPLETLEGLAPKYVGRTVIFDHDWTAKNQTARIYNAEVENLGDCNRLVFYCYMLRAGNEAIINSLEAGILREVSVSCAIKSTRCSICGQPGGKCGHQPGQVYGDALCTRELLDPADAYEVSFVAVPAQPGAGVIKSAGEPQKSSLSEDVDEKIWLMFERQKWR